MIRSHKLELEFGTFQVTLDNRNSGKKVGLEVEDCKMDCGKNEVQFYCHKIQVASIYEGSKLFLPHLFAQCNYQKPFQAYHFLHKTYCGFDCQSLFLDIVDLPLGNVFLENIGLCFCFVLEIIELDNCFCRDDYH